MSIRLGNICKIQSGGTPAKGKSKYYKGNIPWITTTALNGGNIGLNEAVDLINENAIKESAAKIVPARSIMVGTRVGIGKVAINAVEMSTNQDIVSLLDIDENIWNKNFLCKFLQSKSAFLNSQARGATIKGIKINILSELELPEIPIKEQNYISWVIDKVKMILDARQQQLQKLDELIKARFIEMFGDPVTNSKGWPLKYFGEICENLDARRKPITASEREAGIYPYYGASGIVDHVADYIFDEDILLVSEDGANLLMRSTPIAFSVSGKVWVNNHAHVVKFENMSLQKYIESYFSMIDITDQITGSAQPKLNQAKLNAMQFGIPAENLMDGYYDFVNQIDKTKIVVQKALDEAQTLFDSLMQQ